jgi:hypothetical protein
MMMHGYLTSSREQDMACLTEGRQESAAMNQDSFTSDSSSSEEEEYTDFGEIGEVEAYLKVVRLHQSRIEQGRLSIMRQEEDAQARLREQDQQEQDQLHLLQLQQLQRISDNPLHEKQEGLRPRYNAMQCNKPYSWSIMTPLDSVALKARQKDHVLENMTYLMVATLILFGFLAALVINGWMPI